MPQIVLPNNFSHWFDASGLMRSPFKIAEGGRGGGKSYTFAILACMRAVSETVKILCVRQFATSLAESVYPLIQEMAERYFPGMFEFYRDRIECHATGSKFIFAGLDRSIGSVKSTPNIDICWVEEGAYIKAVAWDVLVPTVMRNDGAEIWISMNFDSEQDPIFREFFDPETLELIPRDDVLHCRINYYDNPFLSENMRAIAERMKRNDFEKYLHIYEGKLNRISEAQVMCGKWRVDRFNTPDDAIFYHGVDWGFSADPNVWVRCFVTGNTLYIDRAEYAYNSDYEDFLRVMEQKEWKTWKAWKSYADSARPEGVNYMRKRGVNMYSVGGKTSIEAGIEYLRSFDCIVIHERCKEFAHEALNWKYKIDPKTGDVTRIVVDKFNHGWDALRYAIIKLTKGGVVNG